MYKGLRDKFSCLFNILSYIMVLYRIQYHKGLELRTTLSSTLTYCTPHQHFKHLPATPQQFSEQ